MTTHPATQRKNKRPNHTNPRVYVFRCPIPPVLIYFFLFLPFCHVLLIYLLLHPPPSFPTSHPSLSSFLPRVLVLFSYFCFVTSLPPSLSHSSFILPLPPINFFFFHNPISLLHLLSHIIFSSSCYFSSYILLPTLLFLSSPSCSLSSCSFPLFLLS